MGDVTGTYMEVGAENRVLRQQLERAEARVVEYRDALQSVSRGNLELQRMLNKKADRSNAFIFRTQADAIIDAHNAMSDSFVLEATGVVQECAIVKCQDFLHERAQQLIQKAEKAGGSNDS